MTDTPVSSPQRIADEVWWLPNTASNTYLIRARSKKFIVVDPGLPGDHEITLNALKQLEAQPTDVELIALTHFHTDHSGAATALAAATGAPIAAGARDAAVLRGEQQPPTPDLTEDEAAMYQRIAEENPDTIGVPRVAVSVDLHEGDTLDRHHDVFVWHTPGHTWGSISVHLPAQHVVLTGDLAIRIGDAEPIPGPFSADRTAAAASLHELIESTSPHTVGLGHGAPIIGHAAIELRAIVNNGADINSPREG